MPDYGMVPRALSRLGESVYRGMSDIGAGRLARERLGLLQAKTEFDIGEAKETRAYREKYDTPIKERQLEKIEQERAGEGAPVTFSSEISLHLGPSDAEEAIWRATELPSKVKKGLGLELNEKQQFTKGGLPVTRLQWEQNAYGDQLYAILRSEMKGMKILERMSEHPDPEVALAAKKTMKDPLSVHETDLRLLQELRAQTSGLLSPEADKRLAERIKEERENVKSYRAQRGREKVARIRAGKKTKEGTVKFKYYDKEGKLHSQYISKSQFPAAEKKVREQGGSMEKPTKEKEKPTATDFNSLRSLIDKVTDKGSNEPSSEQAAMINEAAQAIGYEFKERTLREDEKKWYWFDPDKKWVLVKKEETAKGISKEEMAEIDKAGKKVPWEKPGETKAGETYKGKITQPKLREGAKKIKRRGTLEGRKVIEYEDGTVEYAD